MQKQFVITDIHGCYKTFRYLLEETLQPDPDDKIYLLGDYINKGPSSRATLDYVMELSESPLEVKTLMGNHEKHLLDALDDPSGFHLFLEKGGANTLKDFGVDRISAIPGIYLEFMRSLDLFIRLDKYLLVHAGFNFNSGDPFQDREAMLNTRNMNHIPPEYQALRIVHGHVPVPLKQIRETIERPENWNISIDGGCVYPRRRGMGFLTAFELSSGKLYAKECIDEVE